jgi:hypothetical protein
MIMKRLLMGTVLIAIFSVGLAWTVEDSVHWKQFSASLRAYFKYPTPKNAKNAYQYLPASGHVRMKGLEIEREALEIFYTNSRILQRQVLSGDAESVRLAFRLFSITDSAYTEELDVLLGKLIRINPKLFLRELVANQDLIVTLESLLGNEGDEYVDRPKAQCLEKRLRLKALQSVTDPSLRRKRDECVTELERQWQTYCGANNRLQTDGLQPPASGHR